MRTRYSYVACRYSEGCFREFVAGPADRSRVEQDLAEMDFSPRDEVEVFALVPVNDRRSDG